MARKLTEKQLAKRLHKTLGLKFLAPGGIEGALMLFVDADNQIIMANLNIDEADTLNILKTTIETMLKNNEK